MRRNRMSNSTSRAVRAALWFLALLAVGTVVFAMDAPPRAEAGEGSAFNAVVYAPELLFPLIDFDQEKSFQPIGDGQWVAYGLNLLVVGKSSLVSELSVNNLDSESAGPDHGTTDPYCPVARW
ncbi:hypothetical protein IL992_42995 [Microbispora sp. NEAU-D428]|uniref:hypothetical protein n=1 Tax=Microbispora sitophila TaxID=2771537 RepID=UPI001865C8E9|nr:hypothetical protein [Microbispora sitophila]MBE3015883.1 hypothetical protein [Microbispora sitophila]